jgi:hypothetical protein
MENRSASPLIEFTIPRSAADMIGMADEGFADRFKGRVDDPRCDCSLRPDAVTVRCSGDVARKIRFALQDASKKGMPFALAAAYVQACEAIDRARGQWRESGT